MYSIPDIALFTSCEISTGEINRPNSIRGLNVKWTVACSGVLVGGTSYI